VDLSWDGPDPKERTVCPYPVDFYCKPSPAESLNSLQSGRLFIELDLGANVRSVAGRLINNAKSENLNSLSTQSQQDKAADITLHHIRAGQSIS
jgi:hypothetical protein